MAYEKTTWETGDVITAEKLNHLEDGVAGAGGSDFVIAKIGITLNVGGDTSFVTNSCDKTFAELMTASKAGKPVVFFAYGDVVANGQVVDFVGISAFTRISNASIVGWSTTGDYEIRFNQSDSLPSVSMITS